MASLKLSSFMTYHKFVTGAGTAYPLEHLSSPPVFSAVSLDGTKIGRNAIWTVPNIIYDFHFKQYFNMAARPIYVF
jgi:hypothetical protein